MLPYLVIANSDYREIVLCSFKGLTQVGVLMRSIDSDDSKSILLSKSFVSTNVILKCCFSLQESFGNRKDIQASLRQLLSDTSVSARRAWEFFFAHFAEMLHGSNVLELLVKTHDTHLTRHGTQHFCKLLQCWTVLMDKLYTFESTRAENVENLLKPIITLLIS